MKSIALILSLSLSTCLHAQKADSIEAIKTELCKWYSANNNWLPDAFVQNAACVCATSPDEPKANSIRASLVYQFSHTSDSIKRIAELKKQLFLKHKISRHKYKKYVHKNLTPLIYIYHKNAYRNAGCSARPARYWQWKIASTRKFRNCRFLWFRVKCFGGSCNGRFCGW